MPSYPHLLSQKLEFEAVPARVNAMAMLGVPYGAAVKPGEAERLARLQATKIAEDLLKQGGYGGLADKKITALVAYLQRLGTDIKQPPDWDPYAEFAPTTPTPVAAPKPLTGKGD
jgi:cytochrome c oxidase cbb3-type subunit I/II